MSRSATQQSTLSFATDRRTHRWDALESNKVRRNEVTVWWASLSDTGSTLGVQAHLLSHDELRRANWMPSPTARDRWITSRSSLRTILSGYLGVDAVAVPISYGSFGKPELGQSSPVRFNLSHSADLAAFAVAWRKPIGIDVQQIRNDDQVKDLASWTFSEEAYRLWQRLPELERRIAFTRTWVRKEAYLKGRGLGLVYPLRELDIVESQTPGAVQIADSRADSIDNEWRIFDLSTPDSRFVAALAVKGEVSNLISRGWPTGSVRTTWRQT